MCSYLIMKGIVKCFTKAARIHLTIYLPMRLLPQSQLQDMLKAVKKSYKIIIHFMILLFN